MHDAHTDGSPKMLQAVSEGVPCETWVILITRVLGRLCIHTPRYTKHMADAHAGRAVALPAVPPTLCCPAAPQASAVGRRLPRLYVNRAPATGVLIQPWLVRPLAEDRYPIDPIVPRPHIAGARPAGNDFFIIEPERMDIGELHRIPRLIDP